MDPQLAKIMRGLIGAERDRNKTPSARAMAQVLEPIPLGHGYRSIAIDLEAARQFEERAKAWFSIIKRVMAESENAWTAARAAELAHLLERELQIDWEELVQVVRTKNTSPGAGRMIELEGAQNRMRGELAHEFDLLVLAQDPTRIPLEEQLTAPRYSAVVATWSHANERLRTSENDLQNVAKEAVSAVEQLARIVTGNPSATLGDAIKDLRKAGRIQSPLLKGLEEIWGWASDTPGVRHGTSASLNVDKPVAQYVLAQCAAAMALLLAADAA